MRRTGGGEPNVNTGGAREDGALEESAIDGGLGGEAGEGTDGELGADGMIGGGDGVER